MNTSMQRPAFYRPITITEGLRTSARRTPDKLALTEQGREITHRQLIARINKVSNMGLGLGLRHGDRVALMCRNGAVSLVRTSLRDTRQPLFQVAN